MFKESEGQKEKIFRDKIVIAIDGMPGSGKTTHLTQFCREFGNENIIILPQSKDVTKEEREEITFHEDFEKLDRWFLDQEIERTKLVNKYFNKGFSVLIDRPYISILGYCYARAKYRNKLDEYHKFFRMFKEEYLEKMYPIDMLIILKTDPLKSIKRRERKFQQSADKLWFNSNFLTHLGSFYEDQLAQLKFIKTTTNIDTSNSSANDLYESLKSLIKETLK